MTPIPLHADRDDTVVLQIRGNTFRLCRWHGGELPEYGFLLPGQHLGILCEPLNRPLNPRLSSYMLRTLVITSQFKFGYAAQNQEMLFGTHARVFVARSVAYRAEASTTT